MPELNLEERKRQSPVGAAIIFFKNLRIGFNIFLSLLFVQYGFRIDPSSTLIWFLAGLVLLVFGVLSYAQYRQFYFYVRENQFIIEKGVFSRDKVTIPFDRIQSVHTNQNLLQRILNVVGLKIDTAGSATKEMSIAALEKSYARALQKYLLQMKSRWEEKDEEKVIRTEEVQEDKRPLVSLGIVDVIRVGLTENHLRTGLLLFAVINGYLWQYEEYLLKPMEPFLAQQKNYFLSQWLIIVPLAMILFMVISTLLSLIQALLKYYGLRFYINAKDALLVSGLFRRAEYQIPLAKIQYLKWTSNPLRKLIGLKTMVVKQAGSIESADKLSLKIPGIRQEQLEAVLETFVPERNTSAFISYQAHPFLKWQRIVWLGVLPALVWSFGGWFHPVFFSIALLWLILSIFLANKYYPTVTLQCNREVLLLSSGWIFPRAILLKYYKVQNLKIHQNVFQKRRRIVHLDFYTAAGKLRMPQLDEKMAFELYNYLLFRIETAKSDWM